MAEINMDAVKGPELKTHIATLNACGLLPEPIVVKPGRKNVDLAAEFVAGIEATNDIGKLDDVPEAVFNYYTNIVVPTTKAAAAPAPAAAAPAAAPAGRGRGKAKPAVTKEAAAAAVKTVKAQKAAAPAAAPAEKKMTRADVFASIVKNGDPLSKADMEDGMNSLYDGSSKDTSFWVSCYIRLCLALGVMTKNEDKTFTYTG